MFIILESHADICSLYVTTMKAMNFQDDIPSIPIDNSKDHYVLLFDLSLMKDATLNYHYPELVREPLRLELNFIFPLQQVIELIVLRERMSPVAIDKFVVFDKTSKLDNFSLQQIINRIPLLKKQCLGSFPSDYVPLFPNEAFGIIYTQHSYMQLKHWIVISRLRPKLYFGHSFGRSSFLKQQYKHMMHCTSTVSFQRLRLPHDICIFSSLQSLTRRNYWRSQFYFFFNL